MNTIETDKKKLFIWEGKIITNSDCCKLLELISNDVRRAHTSPKTLHTLYLLVTNCKKYDSHEIPSDVITMNSEFILTTERFQNRLVKIVYPDDIKSKHDISLYSAIGMACLGAKEKCYVYANLATSVQKLLIEKIIFQPEREKVFDL